MKVKIYSMNTKRLVKRLLKAYELMYDDMHETFVKDFSRGSTDVIEIHLNGLGIDFDSR